MFTWKPIYTELADKLMSYKSRQHELLELLRSMKSSGLKIISLDDQDPKDTGVPLAEIDPFTFFACFNSVPSTTASRIEVLRRLKEALRLNAPLPTDFSGIPVTYIGNAWCFRYAYERPSGDVPKLWELAEQIVTRKPDKLDAQLFSNCVEIGQSGLAKITMGMFWMRPDLYLALDKNNTSYLIASGFDDVVVRNKSLVSYLALVVKARKSFNLSLPDISYRAWVAASSSMGIDPVELDAKFRSLLEITAKEKGVDLPTLVRHALTQVQDDGQNELTNRVKWQNELSKLLNTDFTEKQLRAGLGRLWTQTGRFPPVILNDYFKSGKVKDDVLALFASGDENDLPGLADQFIENCITHGYRPRIKADKSLAALLASVLLTSKYPDRFVEFRTSYFNKFYNLLFGTKEHPFKGGNYGVLLLKAGSLAAQLRETQTYRACFGSDPNLWAVAGLVQYFKNGIEGFPIKDEPPPHPPLSTPPPSPAKTGDPMNLILYGPPGTGKTYQTIRRAVEIIDGKSPAEDVDVKTRFDQLLDQSRIGFVTFHQSYSYEDFVEGIRPVMDDEGPAGIPRYECRDGIFKTMCAIARSDIGGTGAVTEPDWASLRIWKMSLGYTLDPDEAHIYDDCIKGSFIAHGAGQALDFTKAKTPEDVSKALEEVDWTKATSTLSHNIRQIQSLRIDMRKGDIVIVSYGNHRFRAIGRVVGDYKYDPSCVYPQTRPVKWLRVFDEPQPKDRLLRGKAFSQLTLYPLAETDLKMDSLREMLSAQDKTSPGKYVLIIDEINRGNISKILGELITLIEKDKRRGQPNALTVTLPYSQQPFNVPDNLHILGTMNTADKSIALVDVALRRRFEFKELIPDFNVCAKMTAEMRTVLQRLNQRIVVRKDRDHQIGHAYFIAICDETGFNRIFSNQIIPLLQEYFYNDWDGLRYVLGEEGPNSGTFIKSIGDGDRKWARTLWQWSDEIGEVSILKQLAKNFSAGASANDQAGQSSN